MATNYTLRLDPELRRQVEADAAALGVTTASLIRRRLAESAGVSARLDRIEAAIATIKNSPGGAVAAAPAPAVDQIGADLKKLAAYVVALRKEIAGREAGATAGLPHEAMTAVAEVAFFSSALVKRLIGRQGDPTSWAAQARAESDAEMKRLGLRGGK